ncbi:unnamed protein product [Thelazia callipaeda]|uniref:Uncharacterized protein n=1 Tax=Thelazia callipaeda TaxID=103827 RepID=A0A0N5CZ94_THECL|nr:unnamed protein product [Thelazia callipaeda]
MLRGVVTILLTTVVCKLSTAQFMSPFGMFGNFGTPHYMNPFMGAVNSLGINMGYDPVSMSGMGMNMFNNPYLMNPYTSFAFTNNGNTFAAGLGAPKFGSPQAFLRKRFIPGMGCINRSGCGIGFQKTE